VNALGLILFAAFSFWVAWPLLTAPEPPRGR